MNLGNLIIGILTGGVAFGVAGQNTGYLPKTSEAFSASLAAPEAPAVEPGADPAPATAASLSARRSLPLFLAAAKTPPEGWSRVSLRVALQGESAVEDIWVRDLEGDAEAGLSGALDAAPADLPGLSEGNRVEFAYAQITDWGFAADGKGYGFYSIRATIGDLPEQEQAGLRAWLAEPAEPAVWPVAAPFPTPGPTPGPTHGPTPGPTPGDDDSAAAPEALDAMHWGLGVGAS
ncbi:hypothetical protein AIOL_000600 [Candidatus Rhodobacter oscarellae]|uniref:DUF2314 domain-containing protein n=1 Tax=Candidatus Rhodobacter oscarellae TaxID=1675527 RepID=A0A0J9ECG9_9RHOB|nr:DUF2314 domain-containing protein [Candidatus Rhodobacter lobularis]KMW60445.1 hypothetical protein AIOL_000600 [Candidatus Rhodobacter lobularis]